MKMVNNKSFPSLLQCHLHSSLWTKYKERYEVLQRPCETEQHRLILNGWVTAVDKVLAEDPPGNDEVQKLMTAVTQFASSANDMSAGGGAFSRLMKYAAILLVTNGIIPKFASMNLPINLEKGGTVVWTFVNCEYIMDKTTRKYVSSSHGVSVRLMRGVYYRRSSFTGKPVEKTERVRVDSGSLGVTDKHLYFVGKAKSFRLPYTKITSFEPFSNGIGIFRDTKNAKPEIFVTQDGWFTYPPSPVKAG